MRRHAMGKRLKVCTSLEEAQAVYDIGALLWRYNNDHVVDYRPYSGYSIFVYFVEDDEESRDG